MSGEQDLVKWDEFSDREVVDWKRVRASLEHENNVTNHRVTWLLTSQGFLIAAFALVFQASTKNDVEQSLRPLFERILPGLAFAGILVSVWLGRGIQTAAEQHTRLEEWWANRIGSRTSEHPPICGYSPKLFFSLRYSALGGIFVTVWLVLIVVAMSTRLDPIADKIVPRLGGAVAAVGLMLIGYLWGRRRLAGENKE